jgi:large subunit ribosomal protein L19
MATPAVFILTADEQMARKNLVMKAGDTVRVFQKIEEKGKVRLQTYEGLVIARKHGAEGGATFTVRKVASGVGMERIFPLYSPMIDKIEVLRRAKVRRAKLYYIRDKATKEIARKMKQELRAAGPEKEETKETVEAK